MVTRRPLNCDHATPDVGDDTAPGRLVHLCSHHLNLITDFGHKRLRTFPETGDLGESPPYKPT
jgi:hypothetical protein